MSHYLPHDTIRDILLRSDIRDINALCRTNKHFSSVCNDDSLWKEKIKVDFGTYPSFNPAAHSNTWKQIYHLLYTIRSIPMDRWLQEIEDTENSQDWGDEMVEDLDTDLWYHYYERLVSEESASADPYATEGYYGWNIMDALENLVGILDEKIDYVMFGDGETEDRYSAVREEVIAYIGRLRAAGFHG